MTFSVIDNKTGHEADTYQIALKEEWANNLMYCDMEGFAITEDGTLVLLDECGGVAYCPDGRFTIVFHGDDYLKKLSDMPPEMRELHLMGNWQEGEGNGKM